MPYIGNIIQDFSVSTAMLNTDSVTSIKIDDGTVVNADISDSAAIAMSKLALSITNSEVNASAAIAGSKISPDFGSQNVVTTGTLGSGALSVNTGTTNTCATFTSTDAGAVINLTDNSARSSIEQNGTDLKIISDTDAGDADSTIKLQVDASTKMTILSSGNVGIGETSPANLLHVKVSDAGIAPHGSAQIVLERAGTNYLQFLTANDGTSGLLFGDADDVDVTQIKYDHNTKKLSFITETDEALTIDENQKVGIGSTSPSAYLDVVSDDASGYVAEFRQGNSSNSAQIIIDSPTDSDARPALIDLARAGTLQWSIGQGYNHTGGALHFATSTLSAGVTDSKMLIQTDGKVGIGTTSPSALLDVESGTNDYLLYGSNPRLYLKVPDGTNGLRIDASTTPLEIRNSDANGRTLSFGSGGAANFNLVFSGDYSLSSSGYDSSPTMFFNTTRHNGSTTVTSFQCSIQGVATSNTNNTGYLGFGSSATPDDLIIKTDGVVGIGTTAPEGKGLDITVSRTNSYSGTTDTRNLANLICRNSSGAAGRFAALSFINGGATQAEGSINLVQTADYNGDLAFKMRSAVSTWSEVMRITSAGKLQLKGTRSGALQANDDDALQLYTKSTTDDINRGVGITFYTHDGSGFEMGGTIQVAKENGTADNPASYMRFSTQTGSTTEEAVRIDSAGRLFLGLTTLSYPKKLNVQGESGSVLLLRNHETTSYAANTNTSIELALNTGNTGTQSASCEIRAFKENGTNGDSARALSFYTGGNAGSPTERMRIASGGDVTISDGDLIIGTSGHGIDFSATSDHGGMSSELLDDYEEGTWTPVHGSTGGSAAGGGTYSNQHGTYTKIGDRVHIACYLAWNADFSGAGGNYAIDLPFTQNNNPATYAALNIGFIYHTGGALSSSNESIGGYVSGSKALLYRIPTGQATGAASGGNIANATWSESQGYLQFNITMRV